MKLSPELSRRVGDAVRDLNEARGTPDRVGIEQGAIPLYADLGGAVLLSEDGTLLELKWDQDSERYPHEIQGSSLNGRLPLTAVLVAGVERYPWLAALLPARPPNAIECTTCAGAGRLHSSNVVVDRGLLCGDCGALGWRAA
jgi:hypothetical protein